MHTSDMGCKKKIGPRMKLKVTLSLQYFIHTRSSQQLHLFFPPGKECQFSRYEFSSTEALRVAIFPILLAVSLVPHALLELCPLISER